MEEQTLQFKENLISIRRILVTRRKKIKKLSAKREAAEKQFEQEKKLKMREKMLETPRKINNAVSAGDAKKAKGMGLGNALGLFAIIIIATNFEKVKKLFNDFITGDTFKNIKNYFTGTIDFFKGLYSGLSGNYGELLGDKYDELVAFKDEKMEDIEKLTEYLKELQKNFEALAEQAAEMRDKFLNLMGIETKKDDPTGSDKPYGGLYEKGEEVSLHNIIGFSKKAMIQLFIISQLIQFILILYINPENFLLFLLISFFLSVVISFTFFSSIFLNLIQAKGNFKKHSYATTSDMFMSTLFLYPLISVFGVLGVVISRIMGLFSLFFFYLKDQLYELKGNKVKFGLEDFNFHIMIIGNLANKRSKKRLF